MTEEAIEKILKEKIAEERSKLPTHEYIDLNAVANGRGVSDAGLLYLKATLAQVVK